MSDAAETVEDPHILVLDKHAASNEFIARRVFGTVIVEREFRAWVLAPERGRFTVYCSLDGFESDQIISFADTEPELMHLIDTRVHEIYDIRTTGRVRIGVQAPVALDIRQQIEWRFGPEKPVGLAASPSL
jgi:hypothetical protein